MARMKPVRDVERFFLKKILLLLLFHSFSSLLDMQISTRQCLICVFQLKMSHIDTYSLKKYPIPLYKYVQYTEYTVSIKGLEIEISTSVALTHTPNEPVSFLSIF